MINFLRRLDQAPEHVFWVIPCLLGPRLFGQIDRDPASPTYGCADRYFWRYRLHDLPNARFQEAMLTLALVRDLDMPENPFFKAPLLTRLVRAALGFWLARRHADGSLDEVYPFERSGCATAFSAYAATEVMRRDPALYDPAALTTADWLARAGYQANPNQRLAAALALSTFAELSGRQAYAEAARRALAGLASAFGPGGCLMEYGGEDMGYHTISMSLAAQLRARRPDWPEAAALVDRGLAAFERHLDEAGRIRPGNWSRGTQFVYPLAVALAGRHDLVRRIAAGAVAGVALTPLWQDDRYMIPLLTDYLLCFEALSARVPGREAG
ncbi:hypothetical protein [Desulfolutivibrio sulfoxidireducens]|uniref:hypothetical protein n=1 Tax=Desulfolutivibrio sulfoxidireducens TaxID=2773299 RepID=UPI00159D3AE3|nr:hypothetical protein [Desulfolutivibrio sulfoxidireducens]QLA17813.1 hypothetical protein GD605_17875 [Desulfolutivibrio sulfoxidireducens]